MKTANSLPDDLFHAVERLVRLSKRHRSEVYADALREYVSRHSQEEVTGSLNRALQEIGDWRDDDRFLAAAAGQTLSKTDW
jgi:metal-responsive CopG/Arc/MetJ family transcriptional regulator